MTEQREVTVKGALNLHMFVQQLAGLGITYEVMPVSGKVPEQNYTAYYTNRTVRITASAEQWLLIDEWLDRTRHDQPGV